MNQKNVVAIRKGAPEPETKQVDANQKAVDALPMDSGMWRVKGVAGLYVRCRADSKSFWMQRRVNGELVKRTLGPMTLKEARGEWEKEWRRMKPAPAAAGAA